MSPEALKSPPAKTPTRRGRKSGTMAEDDAIEVRESIEAKGDADKDVTMTDATADAINQKAVTDAPADFDEDADADADADIDAEGDVDAEGEPDDAADADADADGEPDDDNTDMAQQRRRDIRELHNLIDECQAYLCTYKEDEE